MTYFNANELPSYESKHNREMERHELHGQTKDKQIAVALNWSTYIHKRYGVFFDVSDVYDLSLGHLGYRVYVMSRWYSLRREADKQPAWPQKKQKKSKTSTNITRQQNTMTQEERIEFLEKENKALKKLADMWSDHYSISYQLYKQTCGKHP